MSELWLFLVEEMEISTQESTLETRFMGLVFAISLMVTITKELGTKVVSNAMAQTGLLRKAVQSAQEMARKGVDQRRVDEQVVRAVAAANKALDSC
ncbi:unnamed protein product [Brassica rapa]|uniref:Uncharacterized protein n=1 Tax=Brassica campestris TaxID=3711 RepID=A0A8D9MB30_BRACM|nr:unnamed protein product [Brassica rapa]